MKNITFINAGAGSGKTYRLTTDLARKLTQEGLDPSQVILTTFTELAAAEFCEKARKEILNAKGPDGQPIDAQIRIKAATQLDNAFIGTVHSISFRFIRKYWYLLDYGADIQPMSEQNQDFYMSQSISDIATAQDRDNFRRFRDTFDIRDGYSHPDHLFWLPELKSIVDKMEYYDIKEVGESIQESYKTVEQIFTGKPIRQCFAEINPFLAEYKTYLAGESSDKADGYRKTLASLGYQLRNISDIYTSGLKKCITDIPGRGAKKNTLMESQSYRSACQAFEEAFISQDFLPIIRAYLDIIFALAQRWQKALQQYKKENHIISFDDMEKLFLTMLTEPKYKEVQDDIESNIRLLMVDEFQDSNPIQLKIFNRISDLIAKNGGHTVWVGDPKQAIYGFRGSDSRFIKEILDKFDFAADGTDKPEHGPDMLGTGQLGKSWRSRPALVDFANNIFLQPFLDSGLKETQITLKAQHSTTDTMGDEQALYIWRTEKDDAKSRARMLAAQIQELLDSKCQVHHQECDKPTSEITYRDIAVLCFKNKACNDVASELRKLGLPASCEENNLMQCLEVYLLKTLLLFVQNPSDKMVRADLAIMFRDATTEEILKDRIAYVNSSNTDEKSRDHWMDADSDHPYAATIKKLTKLTERYQSLSIYDTVVAIHEELDLDNFVAKWGDATQRKHNLATVVNMAKAYDDMCQQMGIGSSILGFINYLAITKPDSKPDNSANTIKVLTYHRSKGLEWPVVILYQLWKDFFLDEDIMKHKFRGANICESEGQQTDIFDRKHYINLFPKDIGGVRSAKIPKRMLNAIVIPPLRLYKDLKSQQQEEANRLLYVGVTRAKDILISLTSKPEKAVSQWPLGLQISNGASDCPFGEGHGETLIELAESCLPDDEAATPQYQQTTNNPSINGALPLFLSPSSIDSFAEPFTRNEQVAEYEERMIDMKVFAGESRDNVKGTCIHNIFAVYKPGDTEGNLLRATQTLTNFGFPNALLAQKEKIILSIEWLYKFLTEAYGPATHVEHECPLLYTLSTGQILRGEIDLQWYYFAADGQEKCVLIDYKTFPGRRDELEKHTEKYYLQLSAYHAALTAAGKVVSDTLIYYPVQGHVRRLLK